MYLKKIKLKNFRNYEEEIISLKKEINVIYGDNAQGKTNILESIFLCAVGKSFRAKKELELIKMGEEVASVEITYQRKDREGKINIIIDDKKTVFLNGIKQKKLSDLLGKINVVLFTPEDIEILRSGPAKRRKFLNIMISQIRPQYIYQLNRYMQVVEQRNHYLRQIKVENKPKEMLEIWDEKIAEYGEEVTRYRREFIEKIKEKIVEIHQKITEEKEKIEINYQSDCEWKEKFKKELKKSWNSDILKGYTTKGIHRDDFEIKINGNLVNVYGSQGQNRTAILSLKLAELSVIEEEIQEKPILLLDDFMSELDSKRRKSFLENIKNTQVVITGTEDIHINCTNCGKIRIENGKILK